MTLKPLSATKEIQQKYIDFYKSNFALGNESLSKKLDGLKENNQLWKSPFILISQNYVPGKKSNQLMLDLNIDESVIKSVGINQFFQHQESSITNIIKNEKDTIVSSGTGSGKTESFLIPILNHCAKSEVEGIKAIIVYPMNALAGDQVTRLRHYLYTLNNIRKKIKLRPITFGIYNGATPNRSHQGNKLDPKLQGIQLPCPECKKNSLIPEGDIGTRCRLRCTENSEHVIDFQLLSREDLRENPPDILITSYVMLDRILLRPTDRKLFQNNKVKFLVFDEMHTYAGARGADVALMIRRLKRRLEKDAIDTLNLRCIGTSATMSKAKNQQERQETIAKFATNLFGTTFAPNDVFEGLRKDWDLPKASSLEIIEKLNISEPNERNFDPENFLRLCRQIDPNVEKTPEENKKKFLGELLLKNEFFQGLIHSLNEPKSIEEIISSLRQISEFSEKLDFNNLPSLESMIWSYLQAGSISEDPNQNLHEPLLKVSVHNFFRVLPPVFMCSNKDCKKMYFVNKDECDVCAKKVEELAVCRNCSQEFFITKVSKESLQEHLNIPEQNDMYTQARKGNSKKTLEEKPIQRFSYIDNVEEIDELWYSLVEEQDDDGDDDSDYTYRRYKKCLDCGSFSPKNSETCQNHNENSICNSKDFILIETYPPKSEATTTWRPRDCPFCHYTYGAGFAVTQFHMAEKQATVNLFNIIYDHIENKKLLIFTDSRQDAAELAGWIDFAHEDTALKQMMMQKLKQIFEDENRPVGFGRFQEEVIEIIQDEWYAGDFDLFEREREEFKKKLLLEISNKGRYSLERLGLIEYNYRDLENSEKFQSIWKEHLSSILPEGKISIDIENILKLYSPKSRELHKFITTILHMIRREQALQGLEDRRADSRTYAHGFGVDEAGGKIENVPTGIKIHNIVRTNNKFIKFTKEVFEINDDEAAYILRTVWNFLEKRSYLIKRQLRKSYNSIKEANIVSTSKLILSIPQKIEVCPKCKNNYTNIPKNTCPHYHRQKLCTGKTEEKSYEQFSIDSEDSHFFKTFKEGQPSRMAVREHTGAIPEKERDAIQNQFLPYEQKERAIDVVVATPTLELGIDIGDLSTVCLYKSPPSPASYLQRVGRAGRRDGISFINTFFFNSPIDEFYYRNPQDLIKGNFSPPPLKIENNDLLIRHLHALILEQLSFSEESDVLSKKVSDFLEDRIENTEIIFSKIDKDQENIFGGIRQFVDVIEDIDSSDITNNLPIIISKFKEEFDKSLDYFVDEIKACRESIREFEQKTRNDDWDSSNIQKLYEKLKRLQDKTLENHLFDVNFLPRFAFPGLSVTIEDTDGKQMHGGRSRQLAIVEFAPKCEVTYRKKKYQSVGIDLTNVEHGNFYICNKCVKYYNIKQILNEQCPYCEQKIDNPIFISPIAPKKIIIKKTKKSLSEGSDYREAKIDTFMPKPKNETASRAISNLGPYNIDLKKYGNIQLLLTVNGAYTSYSDSEEGNRESQELEICNKCGIVKDSRRVQHYPLNKKFGRTREYCTGNFNEIKSLYHIMPTNVISIKINEKIDQLNNIPSKIFLTTLKNAIIFAGQILCESADGEISGIVKENEILLYDNVDGGAGYVDIIFDRFEEVLKNANRIVEEEYETYHDSCDRGCLRCLWSYRNKRDIRFIDKRVILRLLQESTTLSINDSKKKLQLKQKLVFEKIISEPNDISIIQQIKTNLRAANKRVQIYTPVISNKKLKFLDEIKDWSEIISSLRIGEKSIGVTFFLKKLELIDQKILRRLIESGVEIFAIKDELIEEFSDELGTTRILIDQFEESRVGLDISGGLTEKLWQDYSMMRFGKSDSFIEESKEFFKNLSSNSRKASLDELWKSEDVKMYPILVNDEKSLQEAVKEFDELLKKARLEIKIFDPYMTDKSGDENLSYYVKYLKELLDKEVSIKIITHGHTKNEIQNIKSYISSLGYDIDIISYEVLKNKFNPNSPGKRLFHKRFIIIDGKTDIHIDIGLRFIFAFEKYSKINKETDLLIISDRKTIDEENKVFERYWNYEKNLDIKTQTWPKIDTRKL